MKKLCIFLVLILALAACSNNSAKSSLPERNGSEGSAIFITGSEKEAPPAEEPPDDGAYISITYIRTNAEDPELRDTVFYTYDIAKKALKEECSIAIEGGMTTGVVSKEYNKVYFFQSLEPGNFDSDSCICSYDIASGKSEYLENENYRYNEITLIDPDTILVMAATEEHPMMPARFDLPEKTFTYTAGANSEPSDRYTAGDYLFSYNYRLGTFAYIYHVEEELYSEEYENGAEIETYISVVSKDLVKDPERTFSLGFDADHRITEVSQISENELLVQMTVRTPETDETDEIYENLFYSLVFTGGGESVFTLIDSPYPASSDIYRCQSVDGGRTYYFTYYSEETSTYGLYSYDAETEELTPILLDAPDDAGIIDFYIVG